MSDVAMPGKTPLDFALEHTTLGEIKQKVLEATHALVSTCLTQAMMETAGKSAETIAAEAQAYARQLTELQKHLGAGFSVVPTASPRTVYTTMNRLPQQPPTP